MIRLAETFGASLLPPGRDAAGWHAALAAEITQHLSTEHAQVLARPDATAEGVAWSADGAARTRYADLPAQERRALDAALGAILSDIRRLAESGAAPAVQAAWPALREVPDMGHVFAVDGRPVLAGWGHAGEGGVAGRLARLDDGVRWRAVPRPPWRLYGGALGVLALVALAAGLLLPTVGGWLAPAPAQCMVVPSQLQAMRDEAALEDRGAQLQTLLASLTDEVGRRQLLCPIGVAPAAPLPAPLPSPRPPPPPASPPPRADLPQDQWDRRDLSMLEGCWTLNSTLSVGPDPSALVRVRTWRQCFDGHGHGQQVIVLENNTTCSGPLSAEFDGAGLLHVAEPQPCHGPVLGIGRSERVCRRTSDTEASCDGLKFGQWPQPARVLGEVPAVNGLSFLRLPTPCPSLSRRGEEGGHVMPALISLIPNSGVQFWDVDLDADALPRQARVFWEEPLGGPPDADGAARVEAA